MRLPRFDRRGFGEWFNDWGPIVVAALEAPYLAYLVYCYFTGQPRDF